MNEATISCDTTIFKNHSRLYWQYNCDSIWLTLENAIGQKRVIDMVSVDLYGYTYRLGYHLIKEFDKTILFRSGCPANGPCTYTLIDKNNGNRVKQFGQLICIDTDTYWENAHEYNFEFIVYLSQKTDHIVIYYVDDGRTLKVPFKEKLSAVIPQHQFEEMTLNKNILTLTCQLDDNKKKVLIVDLKNKKNSH